MIGRFCEKPIRDWWICLSEGSRYINVPWIPMDPITGWPFVGNEMNELNESPS